MPCAAPGCKTGYLSDLRKCKEQGIKKSLFQAPKDPDLFRIWQKSIPRLDRKLRPKDVLCQDHFEEECIDRYYRVLLFDGNEFVYPKGHATLKRGSIPTKFPNVPGYDNNSLFKKGIKRKILKERSRKKEKLESLNHCDISNKNEMEGMEDSFAMNEKPLKQNCVGTKLKTGKNAGNISQLELKNNSSISPQNNSRIALTVPDQITSFQKAIIDSTSDVIEATTPIDDSSNDQETHATQNSANAKTKGPYIVLTEIPEPLTFEFLKNNLHMVDKTNSWWIVHAFDDFIVCSRWNTDSIVERKIVIREDLAVKVFLFENETTIGNGIKILSIDCVSKLIFRVERTLICPGIFDGEGKCDGYLQTHFMCKRRNLCLSCIKWGKERKQTEKKQPRKEKKLSQHNVELINFHINA